MIGQYSCPIDKYRYWILKQRGSILYLYRALNEYVPSEHYKYCSWIYHEKGTTILEIKNNIKDNISVALIEIDYQEACREMEKYD